MIFDTHVHYNLDPLLNNWQKHWQKAQESGVKKSVVVGTDFFSSSVATQIAESDSNLYASVGIHPHNYSHYQNLDELDSDLETDRDELKLIIGKSVVAIGETGLDYFRLPPADKDTRRAQQQAFIMHVKLAEKHSLPLIVHVRDQETPEKPTSGNAYWDILSILKKHHSGKKPFVLHCVSGPLNYIKQALTIGAYIGVAGNVTYKKAGQIQEIVKLTPPDRLLVETDAPFLPPQEYRGQVCQPWMITQTVKFLATNLGVNSDILFKNSLRLLS